jgi:pilus assembly protein Flp/PilA
MTEIRVPEIEFRAEQGAFPNRARERGDEPPHILVDNLYLEEHCTALALQIRNVHRFQKNKNSRGQTLVEYALILAFIAVVTISVLASLGREINGTFSRINSSISTAGTSH